VQTIVQTAVVAGVPLLLAALAVLVASRAGVMNIGVEGLMLAGAFFAAWVGHASSNGLGVAAAVVLGGLLGVTLGWVMVVTRADQVVVGVAFNLLALGFTSYALTTITQTDQHAFNVGQAATLPIPLLSKIPWFGVIFHVNWIAYVAYLLVPITAFVLFRTGLGARFRACGEYAEGARAVGIRVVPVRLVAMTVSGMLAGLAGAWLVMGDVGVFTENLSNGRGYIGFVIVILARYRPVGSLVAAAGFGLAQALTFYLQLHGVHIPSQFVLATPYVVTLLAIVLAGKRIGRPPAEEGRPLAVTQ
jgi:general nucleoside transport system permease protein